MIPGTYVSYDQRNARKCPTRLHVCTSHTENSNNTSIQSCYAGPSCKSMLKGTHLRGLDRVFLTWVGLHGHSSQEVHITVACQICSSCFLS